MLLIPCRSPDHTRYPVNAYSWHTGACTYDPQSVTGIISGASVTGAVMQANLRTIR
jgi:hypothetical protein